MSGAECERRPSTTSPEPHDWIRRVVAFLAAVGFSGAANRFPGNAVWPTVAFFSWAYLFTRTVIESPREFGLLPAPGAVDGKESK